ARAAPFARIENAIMRAFLILAAISALALVGFQPASAQAFSLDMDTIATEARDHRDEIGLIAIGVVLFALAAKLVTEAWRQARTASSAKAKSSDRRPVNCDHLFQKKVLETGKAR